MMINPNDPPPSFEAHQGSVSDSRWRAVASWLIEEGVLLFPLGEAAAEPAMEPAEPEAADNSLSGTILERSDFILFARHNEGVQPPVALKFFKQLAKVAWCQTKGYPSAQFPRLKFQRMPEDQEQIGFWDEVEAEGLDALSFIEFTTALEAHLQGMTESQRNKVYPKLGPLVGKGTVQRWINIGKALERSLRQIG
jgi:hypothetical protein